MTDEERKERRQEISINYADGEPVTFLDPYALDDAIIGVTSLTGDTGDVHVVYSVDKLVTIYARMLKETFPDDTDEQAMDSARDQVYNDTFPVVQGLVSHTQSKNYPILLETMVI